MKNYILPILLTSLLLSACSFNGGNKEDLFQKKQQCEKYSKNVITDLGGDFLDVVTMRKINGIFYSPKLQTCLFSIGIYKDITTEGEYNDLVSLGLYDYFLRKNIKIIGTDGKETDWISASENILLEKKILELTGE